MGAMMVLMRFLEHASVSFPWVITTVNWSNHVIKFSRWMELSKISFRKWELKVVIIINLTSESITYLLSVDVSLRWSFLFLPKALFGLNLLSRHHVWLLLLAHLAIKALDSMILKSLFTWALDKANHSLITMALKLWILMLILNG